MPGIKTPGCIRNQRATQHACFVGARLLCRMWARVSLQCFTCCPGRKFGQIPCHKVWVPHNEPIPSPCVSRISWLPHPASDLRSHPDLPQSHRHPKHLNPKPEPAGGSASAVLRTLQTPRGATLARRSFPKLLIVALCVSGAKQIMCRSPRGKQESETAPLYRADRDTR